MSLLTKDKRYFIAVSSDVYESHVVTGDKLLDKYGELFWGSVEDFNSEERKIFTDNIEDLDNWSLVGDKPVWFYERYCDGTLDIYLLTN